MASASDWIWDVSLLEGGDGLGSELSSRRKLMGTTVAGVGIGIFVFFFFL